MGSHIPCSGKSYQAIASNIFNLECEIVELCQLRNRINVVRKENPDIVTPYDRFILKPSKLYSFEDASCLLLPYAELGTLIDVIAVLSSPGLFTSSEHEYLVAYLTEQV